MFYFGSSDGPRYASGLSEKRYLSMFQPIRRRATQSLIAAIVALGLPMAAYSGTINIIMSDMDVMYMGSTHALDPEPDGSLYDAMGGHSGGTLAEATAD